VIDRVRTYVLHHRLLQPGDRVAVAVSGGADSVALLRVLLELRQELGVVLSVAHFHHGIRGAEADADQQFVRELAERYGLELDSGAADVPARARVQKSSLETAARDLRHQWFAALLGKDHGKADKIATAHTLDDQAETVLMRLLRGTGSRGLAGIFPMQRERRLVRPLLEVTRREVEAYLTAIAQPWREDSSNRDRSHTRNRVRHELLPLLERDFNPAIRHTLADLAEVARAEAEYWNAEASSMLSRLLRAGKPSRSGRTSSRDAAQTVAIELDPFQALPLALRRQVLYQLGEQLGITLEFTHIQQLTELAGGKIQGRRVPLPGGMAALRSFRELQFGPQQETAPGPDYRYSLSIPGEVAVPELGSIIRARLVRAGEPSAAGYNAGALLDRTLLAPELTVRNWRAGDRFFPAKTRSPKKLKDLLQTGRLGQQLSLAQRKTWPVIESAGQIVWVRGYRSPEQLAAPAGKNHEAVLIEETELNSWKKE
jgi:tRNA(Ile)-lysidine synthase